jgi:solute carrier family 25, member 33/36
MDINPTLISSRGGRLTFDLLYISYTNTYRIGGMTAATLTSPLDVLKTRLQSDFYHTQVASTLRQHHIPIATSYSPLSLARSGLFHLRETLTILATISRTAGPRALFTGLGPNLIGVVPARAINFYTYGNLKRVLNDKFNHGLENDRVWIHLSSAACAGIVTGTATNPIWLVKTRLQLDKSQAERTTGSTRLNRQYKNSWDCIRQTVRGEGIRGLYRGLSASYLGVTESTLQWVLYEQGKLYLTHHSLDDPTPTTWKSPYADSITAKFLAAATAKLFAAVVTYPHEVVRTRLRQAPENGSGRLKYTGLVQCFGRVWREEGMRGLYGGMTPHLLRVVPSAGIMFGM